MGDLTTVATTDSDKPATRYRDGQTFGRPSIYTQEIADIICANLQAGAATRYAAAAAGIDHDTLFTWIKERPDFSDQVARAVGNVMVRMASAVTRSADGDPTYKGDSRAAIEFLKRRDRANWGDTLDLKNMPADALMQLYLAQQQASAITEDGAPALLPGDDLL